MGKSITGSLGGAFRGVAAIATGALAGVGIAGFLKSSVDAARESNKIGAQTAAVIKSTGSAAHVSAKQVEELATSLSNKTGIDDEAIKHGENLLLTFRNVRNEVGKGNDIFNQASSVLVDMGAALGTDAAGSAIVLGKALNDPIAGLASLSRIGVQFTAQQKDQIKTLVASGDVLGAQKIILRELTAEFGGSAAAQGTASQKLGVAWGNIKEQIGNLLIPTIDSLAERLAVQLPVAVDTATSFFQTLKARIAPVIETIRLGLGGLRSAFSGEGVTSDGFVGAMERIGVVTQHVLDDVARPAVQHMKDDLETLKKIVEDNQAAFEVFGLSAAGAVGGLVALQGLSGLAGVIGGVAGAIGGITTVLATAGGAAALPFIAIGAAIVGIGVGAFVAYQKVKPFHDLIDSIGRAIRAGFGAAVEFVVGLLDQLGPVLTRVVDQLAPIVAVVRDDLGGAFGAVESAVASADAGIRSVLAPFVDWFNVNVVSTIVAEIDFMVAAFDATRDAINVIVQGVEAVAQVLADVLMPAFHLIGSTVSAEFHFAEDAISAALGVILGFIRGFLDVVGPLWSIFWASLRTTVEIVLETIRAVIELVLGVIRGTFQFFTGLLTGDWSKAWEGIRTIFSSTFGKVLDLARNIIGDIVGLFAGLPGRLLALVVGIERAFVDVGSAILRGISKGVGAATEFVTDFAKGLANAVIEYLNRNIVGRINDAIPDKLSLGPFSINLPDNPIPTIPTLHQGGIVPGPTGAEVIARLQAGELVTPIGAAAPGDGGGVHLHEHYPAGTDQDYMQRKSEAKLRKLQVLGVFS